MRPHSYIRSRESTTRPWYGSKFSIQDLPPAEERGWMCTYDLLTPVLMTKDPAPSGVVEMTWCKCKKSLCSRRDVACKKNKLSCAEDCACMAGEDCQNSNIVIQLIVENDDEKAE